MLQRGSSVTGRLVSLLALCLFGADPIWCAAQSWPTYRGDNSRSGVSLEPLSGNLDLLWQWQSTVPPQPAWDEPGIWDGYHRVFDLKNRQEYDKALHVVADAGKVLVASSMEDQLLCLSADSGELLWRFTAEGPLRMAPSLTEDRVLIGSDDGYVYCLSLASGEPIWRRRLGPDDRRLPGNQRMISRWAVRTGVVVMGGVAYACGGIFPSDGVYVSAIDLGSGELLWQTPMHDLPAQGYMLASDQHLYVMTGRSRPVVFDRHSGQRLYQAAGGVSGTFALLAGDALLYGPGKTGQLAQHPHDRADQLATFEGNQMIVSGAFSYLHTDTRMSALNRQRYVQLAGQLRSTEEARKEATRQLRELEKERASTRGQAAGEESDDTPQAIAQLRRTLQQLSQSIDELTEQQQDCFLWQADCDLPLGMILAGQQLIAGGRGAIGAWEAATGRPLWRLPVEGAAFGLAVSEGRLLVSTDRGGVYCFGPADESAGQAGSAAEQPPTLQRLADVPARAPLPSPSASRQAQQLGPRPVPGLHGPFFELIAPGELSVTWQTDRLQSSQVQVWLGPDLVAQGDQAGLTHRHHLIVGGLSQPAVHEVILGGQDADGVAWQAPPLLFDHAQHYLPLGIPRAGEGSSLSDGPANPATPLRTADPLQLETYRTALAADLPYQLPESRWAEIVDRLLAQTAAGRAPGRLQRGYALILGAGDGRLIEQLIRTSWLQLVVVEPDARRATHLRELLSQQGWLGVRASVHQLPYQQLPYGPYFANLICSPDTLLGGEPLLSAAELWPHLRPSGGVLVMGSLRPEDAELSPQMLPELPQSHRWQPLLSDQPGQPMFVRRGDLEGSGSWTHQYALPDNSAASLDELVHGPLEVLWFGRPGARPMPDRGPRNPAPVSAGGVLFVQGDRSLFGIDAYNGTILWAKQIPTMRRANLPRDGSNMVATPDTLYVAIGSYVVGFDAHSGQAALHVKVPAPGDSTSEGVDFDWGYLAVVGDQLIGSAVPAGSHYLGDGGEWYEDYDPEQVSRITSRQLFAIDRHSGEVRWRYERGAIINSTLTVADDLLCMVESRNPEATTATTGRLLEPVQQAQHLVALDLTSGGVRWEKPVDFSRCQYMTYMGFHDNTLLVTGSDSDKVFHLTAIDSRDGQPMWESSQAALKKHHSGHLSHPVLLDGQIYHNKQRRDLRTGQILEEEAFDWHGCGVMAASRHAIFQRFEFHGMLDLKTKQRTEFLGVRTGCWLGMIPAGGVLLIPESGSGCFCDHAIQTSMAMVPKAAMARREAD